MVLHFISLLHIIELRYICSFVAELQRRPIPVRPAVVRFRREKQENAALYPRQDPEAAANYGWKCGTDYSANVPVAVKCLLFLLYAPPAVGIIQLKRTILNNISHHVYSIRALNNILYTAIK